jgi:hypothetical protein
MGMRILRRSLVAIVTCAFLLGSIAVPHVIATVIGKEADVAPSAEQLVADALRAEIDGNSAKRRVLLSVAIDAQPEFAPARWQSGQVMVDGRWKTVPESQAAAATNPARAQYKSLRSAAPASPGAHLELARWCRRNGLEEESRLHWMTLLTYQPQNSEALRALGVRWFNGRLMSKSEIAAAKAAANEAKQAAREYSHQVARWERLMAAGDIDSRDQALNEIRQLRDTHAIAALEEKTLDSQLNTNDDFEQCLRFSEAWLAALAAMPEQEATRSLVRHAAFSPLSSIRDAAIAELKQRSPHDYVPLLLSALAMPIESTYRVVTDSDGSVHYFHSLYREGAASDWSFDGRLSAMQHDLQGPTNVTIDDQIRGKVTKERFGAANNPLVRAEMASVARANQQRFGSRASSADQQIAAANRATEAANAVVIPLLVATTGEDFGDNPRAWWDWWLRYNEYSTDDDRPVQEQRFADSTHQYYRAPSEKTVYVRPVADPQPRPQGRTYPYGQEGRREVPAPRTPVPMRPTCECFAAGTLVWTRTGREPIESLQIGDFVLSQNVDTGELTYKPVLGRTVRPPSPCHALEVGDDRLVAAAGHPFWVTGIGWRMAKELDDGAVLHGLNGPEELQAIAGAEPVETYNLVVADFNTYFVGQCGVLVHDVTPRSSTTAVLPGFAAQAIEATTKAD